MNEHELDGLIYRMVSEGASQRHVAELLHVGRNRIQKIIQNQPLDHTVGRPKKLTTDLLEKIELLTCEKGNLSDDSIAKLIWMRFGERVSRSLVNKGRHKLNFRYLPPKNIQKLTILQMNNRLQFCSDYLSGAITNAPILFSDESRFVIGDNNKWVWRRKGQYDSSIFKEKEKFNKSIMIWGAVGFNFKSELIIHDGIIDSDVYVDSIFKSKVIEQAEALLGHRQFYLMHDGATCHTSDKTMGRLSGQVNILPGWPANSPDLNPIESLWGCLKRSLKWGGATTKEQAKEILLKAWRDIPINVINSLVSGFEMRLRMTTEAKGASITPMLSACMTHIPRSYSVRGEETYRTWTRYEDSLILSSVNTLGRKFKEFEPLFVDRPWQSIKARFKYLSELKLVDRSAFEIRSFFEETTWQEFQAL